ncbi:MAG: TolC family protein [Spirochaetes bacterium]|nr:TolC family protein [Spirochaetota bacterium]
MNRLLKVLFFLFLSVYILYGQDKNNKEPVMKDTKLVIDVDTAISLALANNLDIKTEKSKYDSKLWAMITSWNIFIPDMKLTSTLAKSNLDQDQRTTPTFKYEPTSIPPISPDEYIQPEWTISAAFQLNLPLNAAMGFQVYQTVLDYQNGKISLDNAKNKVTRDTKKDLYNLILLQKNIEIMEKSIATAEKRYNQANALYRNGIISEYDMMSAQVAYENLKPQLMEMKNGYSIALLNFKQIIGIKRNVEIELRGEISAAKIDLNYSELENKYLNNNLDLKLMMKAIQSLQNLKYINISSLTPSVIFSYTLDPYFKKDALKYNWFKETIIEDDDKDYSSDYYYRKDNWSQRAGMFGITLSIPVSSFIPFSKEQMNIVQSQFQINQNKIAYQKMKEGIELKLQTTVISMHKSIESIDVLKLNIKLAERAYQKAEEAYAAGSKELLDVQNSELELKKAELNLLKEELNYTSGLLDIEYILNTKL